MAKLFQPHTSEQQLNGITKLLPNGRAFATKNIDASTFRTYLSALVPEVERFESTFLQISEEHDINFADSLLDEWEKALGIPDDCFPATGTIEERRLHVIIKLACMNVSTVEDFEALGAKFGIDVNVISGGGRNGISIHISVHYDRRSQRSEIHDDHRIRLPNGKQRLSLYLSFRI